MRETRAAMSAVEILTMEKRCFPDLVMQWVEKQSGEIGHPVLPSFPIPHYNLRALKVDILDTKPDALLKSQSTAVQELCHELYGPAKRGDQTLNLVARKDNGYSLGTGGMVEATQSCKVLLKHLPVKEQDCVESQVLCGSCDAIPNGEIREKGADFELSHRLRMPFAMEKDKMLNPIRVGLFRSYAEMAQAA